MRIEDLAVELDVSTLKNLGSIGFSAALAPPRSSFTIESDRKDEFAHKIGRVTSTARLRPTRNREKEVNGVLTLMHERNSIKSHQCVTIG